MWPNFAQNEYFLPPSILSLSLLIALFLISLFILGIVNLTECYRVSGSAAVKGHRYVFDVCTKDRKYHLAADTPSEKHGWIQMLNEVLFSTSVVPSQVTEIVTLNE